MSLPSCHTHRCLKAAAALSRWEERARDRQGGEMSRLRSGRRHGGSDGAPFPTRCLGSAAVSGTDGVAPRSTLKLTRTDQQQDFLRPPMGTAESFRGCDVLSQWCTDVPAALGTLANVTLHKKWDSLARMWKTSTARWLLQSQGVLQERYSVPFFRVHEVWRGALEMTHFFELALLKIP